MLRYEYTYFLLYFTGSCFP